MTIDMKYAYNLRAIGSLNPYGMRPLFDNVVLEVLPEDWVLPSGLVIPQNSRPSSCQGRVIATGPQCSGDVAPGDHILFEPWSEANEDVWVYDEVEHLVLPESRILGIIDDN